MNASIVMYEMSILSVRIDKGEGEKALGVGVVVYLRCCGGGQANVVRHYR